MVIKKAAMAGALECSDARVTVEPRKAIILNSEDTVTENQKDAARFKLYRALRSIDYDPTKGIVRINGLDIPHWQGDIRGRQADIGVGVCTVDGKTVDIPFQDVKRIIALAKACEVYHGDL